MKTLSARDRRLGVKRASESCVSHATSPRESCGSRLVSNPTAPTPTELSTDAQVPAIASSVRAPARALSVHQHERGRARRPN